MAKHGKKYTAALAKVDLEKEYSVRDAIALAKDTSITVITSYSIHYTKLYDGTARRARPAARAAQAQHAGALRPTQVV